MANPREQRVQLLPGKPDEAFASSGPEESLSAGIKTRRGGSVSPFRRPTAPTSPTSSTTPTSPTSPTTPTTLSSATVKSVGHGQAALADDATDPEAALAFLDDFFGADKRHLVAIKKPNGIEAHHYDSADRDGQQKFITDHSAAGFDIYFSPNPIKGTIHKKATKNDVIEATHLWIDLDPRKNEPLDAERDAMVSLLTSNLPQRVPPPNRVIDSGRGFWGYWRLATPQPVDGSLNGVNGPLTEAVECYGRGIEQAFGDRFADGCRNIDRIARLPGTVNRKTGRLARVLHEHSHDGPHAIESFPRGVEKAEAVDNVMTQASGTDYYEPVARETLELAKLSAAWVMRIFEGDADGKYQNDRSRLAFAVACELVRAGFDDDFIARVLMTTRCGEHVQENPDYRLPRTLRRARTAAADPNLKQMNDEYTAGSVNGKFRVLRWMPHPRYPLQRMCEFQTKTDFGNSTVNPKVEVPKFNRNGVKDGTVPKARGAWWLEQDHRSQFDGIDFRPRAPAIIERQTHDGRTLEIVNMFSGFSCLPSAAGEAGCHLFLAHVHDNICDGGEAVYTYVLDWMASGIQHPEDPGRSSLSLRGDPGCGKGVFALGYGRLFGRHFLHATHRDHVTGKFNSHQAEACLIFVDEALYSQIKGDAQILKTLTTETTKLLELKGIDAVEVDNYARLIFATNDPHPIMIEHNDRRYPALYVRNQWVGMPDAQAAPLRKAYFQPIIDQMKNGGQEALLGFLLDRDISNFNAEAIPATQEREHQKLLSASPGDKIIIGFAQDGWLPGSMGRPDAARPYLNDRRDGLYPAMKQSSGRGLQYESDQDLAEILKGWRFERKRERKGTVWIAPPLAQLRADIAKKYPAIEWENTITEWEQEDGSLGAAVGQTAEDVGKVAADPTLEALITNIIAPPSEQP
jgi:hypothetical protein